MNYEINEKKSFLLYLDNWETLKGLSVEQRGWVLTIIYEYAEQIGVCDRQELQIFLERYPEVDETVKVACSFLCTTIARDTKKWLCQQESKHKKALEKRMQGENVTVPPKSYAGSQNYPGASGIW